MIVFDYSVLSFPEKEKVLIKFNRSIKKNVCIKQIVAADNIRIIALGLLFPTLTTLRG